MKMLNNFWYRQSILEAQTKILEDDRKALQLQNDKYKDFIRSMNKTDKSEELLSAVTYSCLLAGEPPCKDLNKKYRYK